MREVSLQEVLRRANPTWNSCTIEYATQRLIEYKALPVRPIRRKAKPTMEAEQRENNNSR